MSAGKVLIVLSDAHSFPITKKDGTVQQEPSGVFLTELATPLQRLLDAGYDVTFASPTGQRPAVDPLSESLLVYFGAWWQKRHDSALFDQMQRENNLAAPRPFASLSDAELAAFAGVFVPGGHAPLQDLGDDPELGRIMLHFHSAGKPTAVICHGPLALLATKYAPGSPGFAYVGYRVTPWSDEEERVVETLKGGEIPKVAGALAAEGAEIVSTAANKAGAITVDRELVSGANPMAARALGEKFVELLEDKRSAAS